MSHMKERGAIQFLGSWPDDQPSFALGQNHLAFCFLEQLIIFPLSRQAVLHAFLNSGTAACQNFVLGRDMAFQGTADCHDFD